MTSAGQQLKFAGQLAWERRWSLATDANGDGIITISDFWAWVEWVFFAPGDFVLLSMIIRFPDVALFLEMTPSMLSGWLSGAISMVLLWLAISVLDRF